MRMGAWFVGCVASFLLPLRSASRYAPHPLCVPRPQPSVYYIMPRPAAIRRAASSSSSLLSGYVFVHVAELREFVTAQRVADPDDMMLRLTVPGCPFVSVLELVLSLRSRPQVRAGHNVNVALAELRAGTPSRWVEAAVRRCFAIYCALRQAALPHATGEATCVGIVWFWRGG